LVVAAFAAGALVDIALASGAFVAGAAAGAGVLSAVFAAESSVFFEQADIISATESAAAANSVEYEIDRME
jgi:hypothetical protein